MGRAVAIRKAVRELLRLDKSRFCESKDAGSLPVTAGSERRARRRTRRRQKGSAGERVGARARARARGIKLAAPEVELWDRPRVAVAHQGQPCAGARLGHSGLRSRAQGSGTKLRAPGAHVNRKSSINRPLSLRVRACACRGGGLVSLNGGVCRRGRSREERVGGPSVARRAGTRVHRHAPPREPFSSERPSSSSPRKLAFERTPAVFLCACCGFWVHF